MSATGLLLSVLAQAGGTAPAAATTPVPAPTPRLPGDQVAAFVLLNIVLILVAARLVGKLFVKLGQPRVVGEIVAGILLGPSLLGRTVFAWDKPWKVLACGKALAVDQKPPSISDCLFPPQSQAVLTVIGAIALTFFMFLVGLDLDFNLLKGKMLGIVSVAVGVVAVPIGVAFLITPALYNKKFVGGFGTPTQPTKTAFALMIGSMLAVTAFPVAVRILQEKGLASSAMGAIAISAAALVTILMFLSVGVASGVASKAGGFQQFKRFAGLAILIAVLFLAVRPALASLFERRLTAKGMDGEAFAVLLIVVFACAYLADRVGVNVIVGGFLAGLIMPARQVLAKEFTSRISDLTIIVLLPIFLAVSGLRTDFTKLGSTFMAGLALFLVAGIAAKWLGGLLFAKLGGMSWKEGNVVGILMNCRGLLVLVVALIALNTKVITPQMQVGGVLMALITTGMTGPLVDRFIGSLGAGTAQPGATGATAAGRANASSQGGKRPGGGGGSGGKSNRKR